jgi:hypothetical protein
MVDHFSFGFDIDARTVTLLGREYSLATFLRTTIFLCGYLLLRPYLLKLSGKFQASDHARDVANDNDEESPAATGKVACGAEEDSDGEDQGWGAKERRRARAERQRIMEEEREADEHEDKELEALLED